MQTPELKNVRLTDISVSKTNPRKHFDQDSINELANSVKEKGVIQAIVLRPKGNKYELVCGERRYRASVIVSHEDKTRDTIPSIIRELNDEEVLQLQIIENLQRKDVHPMDEAVAFKSLMAVKGFDVAEIAKRIGKGAQYVAQRLKLNDLIDEFQKAFFKERLNLTNALKLCKLTKDDQAEFWNDEDYGDNNEEIEVSNWDIQKHQRDLNNAPFDTKDPSLNKTMGGCGGCPFNSSSNTLLFPELAHTSVCTNTKCYSGKADASFAVRLVEAEEDPSIVLISTEYNVGKAYRDLIAKGLTVLKRYEGYENTTEKPEAPDRAGLYGDYDTKEEEEQAWQEVLKEYDDDLKKYEAKINSGKLIKAFIVEGENRGAFIYVTLKKGARAATSSSAFKAKEKEDTISATDIKAEIDRIKDREKRNQELDEEKKQPLLYGLLNKTGIVKVNGPLVLAEKRGLLVLLAEFGSYTIKSDLYKAIDCKNSDDYNQARIYEHAAGATEKQLDQWISTATRILFAHKLSPIQGIRPATNGKAAVLVELVTHYDKKGVDLIEYDSLEAKGKRELKLETRIASLQKQLKELNKPEANANPAKDTKATEKKK